MSAHARFPVDPEARIAPDKMDQMADVAPIGPQTYMVQGTTMAFDFRRALRQAAHDARTLEALRAWLTSPDGYAARMNGALRKLDNLEASR